MLRLNPLLLLVSLLADGGAPPPASDAGSTDAGVARPRPATSTQDAGTSLAATGARPIQWPEEIHPLATLDGPAVLAAHTALQEAMKRFPKQHTHQCAFSPRSLELRIGFEAGIYFVQVERRVDKCPGFGPGVTLEFDWFEVYAISPDGRFLERAPYHP
ncbi:hypothetical protein [Myxococcus qinghaiensis]|uniref:hypothetical protein n=1 Tax=Myxococcus qinghaiensis TaxID=2906758 RepID=UPI0020A7B606|nr:hypothetical protein [Myxococcus qinghaiensis]MCP3165809.1 hypothetical protein [Myxococcus qinghaiensis]